MIKSQKIKVRGVPYPKTTGNKAACSAWTDKIVEKTANLKKVTGPCLLRVTFKLTERIRSEPISTVY